MTQQEVTLYPFFYILPRRVQVNPGYLCIKMEKGASKSKIFPCRRGCPLLHFFLFLSMKKLGNKYQKFFYGFPSRGVTRHMNKPSRGGGPAKREKGVSKSKIFRLPPLPPSPFCFFFFALLYTPHISVLIIFFSFLEKLFCFFFFAAIFFSFFQY